MRLLGADEVVDYTTTRFEEVAAGVDVVLDPLGGETLEGSLDAMRKGGRVVSLVADPDAGRARQRGIEATRVLVRPDGGQLAQVAAIAPTGVAPARARHRTVAGAGPHRQRAGRGRSDRGMIVVLAA